MFDTDIEENEPTLDLENDPDIALLIDDEEEQTEGEPAKKQVAPPKPALDEETQSIIDRLKKDPSLLDRRTPPPVVEQPRQPVQPQPTFDLEKQADEFERDFIKDPKQAYKKHIVGLVAGVAQTVRSNVEQDMNARFGRQGMGNAENVIDSYVKTIRDSNPLVDDEVERRVLERIEEAKKTNATVISNMSPAEIRKSLQGLTNEIVGEVQVRKALKKTAASPPNYSGSGKSGRPAGNLSLTDDERGFIKNLRAAGLSEKDVKESLREYRRDMGR